MYTNGRTLDDLSVETLQEWKEQRVEESKTLDFKRDAYEIAATKTAPRKDLASAICGFANAGGGIILLGVDEERGEGGSRVGDICGIRLTQGFATYQKKVEEIVRQAFEPRGVAVRLREIPLETGKPVVAIGIERSIRSPHRLCAYNSTDFFIRTMKSIETMDVDQIREAFRRGFVAASEAESRLADAGSRVRVPSSASPAFWSAITPMHPTPYTYPPRDPRLPGLLRNMARFRKDIASGLIGYDARGIFLHSPPGASRPVPLFRIHPDGTLERTNAVRVEDEHEKDPGVRGAISGADLAMIIGHTHKDFEEVRAALGIAGPALLTAGVFQASGFRMLQSMSYTGKPQSIERPPPIDVHPLFLSPPIETSDEYLRRSFKELADFFWYAWGYPECDGFDQEGNPTPSLMPSPSW